MAAAVKALKMVDLPTFGNPTIPQRNPIVSSYILQSKISISLAQKE
jgi:hypothetical protein